MAQNTIQPEWPEDYRSLFSSLDEEDICEPPEIPFSYESIRQGRVMMSHLSPGSR